MNLTIDHLRQDNHFASFLRLKNLFKASVKWILVVWCEHKNLKSVANLGEQDGRRKGG